MPEVDLLRAGLFEQRGRPASEDALLALEHGRSIPSLPTDYRMFLQEGDGARFRQYNELESSFHGGLREVFALEDSDASSRLLHHVLRVYIDRVPPDFLPVADDSSGNLICLGLGEGHFGEVFFWDHEMEREEGFSPTMDNMEHIADSFEDFLERVKIV